MARTVGLLLAYGLGWAAAHPLCFFNDRPTDFHHKLSFCPPAQDGACCTDAEEAKVRDLYDDAGTLSPECGEMYMQVMTSKQAKKVVVLYIYTNVHLSRLRPEYYIYTV